MGSIIDYIKQRNDQFTEVTKQILELMAPTVLAATVEAMELQDQSERGRLTWTDVMLYDDGEPMVIVAGLVKYEIGDTVALDSDATATITADNQFYFQKIIRVALPNELIVSGTKEDIYDFLIMSKEKEEEEASKEEPEIDDRPFIDNDIQHEGDYHEPPSNETDPEDFDLEALNDDQRASLELYLLSKSRE